MTIVKRVSYVTLLDYDLGRHNAGRLRLKYAADQLSKVGIEPPLEKPKDASAWRALGESELKKWYSWVKSNGVYFSLLLDLDMMMLKAFPEQYQSISSIKDDSKLNADDYVESVFGKAGNGLADYTKKAPKGN